jgi:flagellar L-ring protein precursor FlgH
MIPPLIHGGVSIRTCARQRGTLIVRIVASAAMLAIAACATTPPTNVHQPMSARPAVPVVQNVQPGAIFQTGAVVSAANYVPLFEDRRARNVGDTLVIVINEKTNASKKSNTSTSRKSDTSFGVPALAGLPGKSFLGSNLSANSSSTFDGKGESASNNDFTGTISVTVIEVLPNGNLVVSGEKQIGLNQGQEFIRLSGVVNPSTITGNVVSSVQVADARIEYRANGTLESAQVMGWLARFFLTFLPF